VTAVRMCKKIPYDSYRAANAIPGKFGKPYRCSWCGMWHVGHAPKRKHRAALRAQRQRRKWSRLLTLIDDLCGVKKEKTV